MIRYVALLRGIAPSGANMGNDQLRAVFERLGFESVGSVLASGNILFRTDATDVGELERRIEDALTADLGLQSRSVVRSLSDLRSLVDSDPFPGLSHSRGTYLTVTFLKRPPAAHVVPQLPEPLARVARPDSAAQVILAVTDAGEPGRTSALMAWLDGTFGKEATTRSWRTVLRIVARMEG